MKTFTLIILSLLVSSGAIENNSVDGIKLGMDISEFLDNKSGIYNVAEETISLEGDDYPIFNVYDKSELIYAVEPDDTGEKIWRIWLYGKKFKTDLGIGVGNTLGDLRKKYNITDISTVEGRIVIHVKEIKVGFHLNVSQVDRKWWNEIKVEELNDNILIDLIII